MKITAGLPLALAFSVVSASSGAETFGKREHVRILSGAGLEVTAALTGGGAQTVVYASDMKYFLRDGDTWVRFMVDSGSVVTGKRLTIEKALIKDERVQQKDGGIEHISRVRGELCVGTHVIETELRVSDRRSFTAPIVIGRDDLAKLGSVDPAREFMHEPDCRPPSPPAALAPTAQ